MTSLRTRRACALFGLDPSPRATRARRRRLLALARADAARLDRALRPGQVAFVTGPSGAGKSLLLAALARRLRAARRAVAVARPVPPGRAALDLVLPRAPVEPALRLLAAAGLADAPLLARPARALSAGQRARLAIARAMARANRPGALLVLDEFAAPLDRTAAASLARTVRRWAARAGARVVCASAHDDVLEPLAPAVLVLVRPGAPARLLRHGESS